MARHSIPPKCPPCDVVKGCKHAWVAFVAIHKTSHRHIETRHLCACLTYMLTIPHARIEVRIAR